MNKKKPKTYLEKRLDNKEFREGFEEEYISAYISEKLAKMRHKSHLTQNNVAHLMHTTKSVISRYESGRYKGYTIETLMKFARACGKELQLRFIDRKKHKKKHIHA